RSRRGMPRALASSRAMVVLPEPELPTIRMRWGPMRPSPAGSIPQGVARHADQPGPAPLRDVHAGVPVAGGGRPAQRLLLTGQRGPEGERPPDRLDRPVLAGGAADLGGLHLGHQHQQEDHDDHGRVTRHPPERLPHEPPPRSTSPAGSPPGYLM